MPNWCSNYVSILGPEEKMNEFYSLLALNQDDPPILSFDKVVPRPKTEDANWHEWNNIHWGVKWEIEESYPEEWDENSADYYFETAWGPPLAFFKTVSEMFPLLSVFVRYAEPGMMFGGRVAYLAGEVTEEQEYNEEEFIPFAEEMFGMEFDEDEFEDEEEE